MAATLMIQGTTSNAGKSVIAAGLCRLFAAKGYKVAPFKPQNMALNSCVTVDGGEIGRSQAVQALACGMPAHTDMNPILLKPNSDTGAMVIIHGQSIGNLNAREYHAFKKSAMPYVLESYHRLAGQVDIVIVEGAGSPAEINLRENDIANMGFATAVNCAVVLVADIDRGGVFAHLTGTVDCLAAAEQALIKGFFINRFRGEKALLDSGIDWLTKKTNIPTLAVLPFLQGLHIEAEDALDLPPLSLLSSPLSSPAQKLKVVVPRIPRISNHTDFDVLRLHSKVDLQFVAAPQTIPPSDLIVLPGSKNTIDDLQWLLRQGWHAHLKKHLRYGGKIIGICGGLQMLGRLIHDPDGIESQVATQAGLGLMDFVTTLKPIKQLRNVSGRLALDNAPVDGYEIHIGATHGPAMQRAAVKLGERNDGAISADNQIFCTYLHGLFDNQEACNALLKWAGLGAGSGANSGADASFDYLALREREIDRVAQMIAEEADFAQLAEIAGLAV